MCVAAGSLAGCGGGGSPAAAAARARVLGHRQLLGRPPGQPLPPDAPRGVRADLRERLPDQRQLRLRRARPTWSRSSTASSTSSRDNDIPITAYLFDGSAWSRAGSTARNACTGPDCCEWNLGDQPVERLARLGVRGVLHFWGGCHDDEQYRRASTRLGGNLLGFYLDDGSSDAELMGVAEFMEGSGTRRLGELRQGLPEPRAVQHDPGARALGERRRTSAICRSVSTG